MKTLVTLMLVYMLFSEALQGSAALRCYQCDGPTCYHRPVECSRYEDRCIYAEMMHAPYTVKACATKTDCDVAGRMATCCDTDLCNKDLQPPTLLKCYECLVPTCDPKPVECPFFADRCFFATSYYMGRQHTLQGCSTKAKCYEDREEATCCVTDLCNSDESVKPSLSITNQKSAHDLLAPTALKCYECEGLICALQPVTCPSPEDQCFTKTTTKHMVLTHTAKGCSTKTECDKTGTVCCGTDLCNGAEGVNPIHPHDVFCVTNHTLSSEL
ncbi:urokinase plasminogen activator surface receptor-like [Colossoma macropomum]|uniref:urokinase plasminogen activator surface receptor-like n=1 Tax=Colossoma macropomum TaxID=42526 RepID=UPI001864CEF8|nr:urokinase plasminogen activator surface receptor-like [Colossoma macropomum]